MGDLRFGLDATAETAAPPSGPSSSDDADVLIFRFLLLLLGASCLAAVDSDLNRRLASLGDDAGSALTTVVLLVVLVGLEGPGLGVTCLFGLDGLALEPTAAFLFPAAFADCGCFLADFGD